jgi:REP element-mobilizing transposase RayT
LPRVCISYGCRLEFMEVSEDCLHWVAVLPPTRAIAEHIQTVRQYTSSQVFEIFSEYLRENFSRDFWAPGYSVLAGTQGHTEQDIRAFVLNYRGGQHYYGIRPTLEFGSSA